MRIALLVLVIGLAGCRQLDTAAELDEAVASTRVAAAWKTARVRRSKLYYLRALKGKAARMKEQRRPS